MKGMATSHAVQTLLQARRRPDDALLCCPCKCRAFSGGVLEGGCLDLEIIFEWNPRFLVKRVA